MIRRPLVYAAAAFTASIVLCFYGGVTIALALTLALMAVLLCSSSQRKSLFIVMMFCFLSIINYQQYELGDCEMLKLAEGKHVISGKIISVERKENGTGQKYIQMKVDVDETEAGVLKEKERVLLKYYGSGDKDKLINNYSSAAPSDQIKAAVKLEIPQGRRNPRGFDYALYLKSLGINVTAYAERIEFIHHDNKNFSRAKRKVFMTKESYLNKLAYETDEETSALMRAILFGEKSELDEEVTEEFRENGIAHILAVSGLHVGIIYAFFNSIWLWKKKKAYFISVMVFFTGYMFLASFSPSVVRAVCMIGLHILAQITDRRYDIISAASLVTILMLTRNPFALFNVGFQMSFLAVFSIAMLLPIFRKVYNGIFLCSISVQTGLMPYLMYMFNCMPAAAVFINLPAAMLAGVLVPAGVCAMFLCKMNGMLFAGLAVIIHIFCDVLLLLNSFAAVNTAGAFYVCSPNICFLCAFYISFFVFLSEECRMLILRRKKKMILIIISAIIIISVAFGLVSADNIKDAELVFLDVGQGDAVHLCVRDGVFGSEGLFGTGLFTDEKNYLFDGGGSDSYNVGKKTLKSYLLKNGVKKLDGAFVTHLHTDHYKGIVELCREGMVDKLYLYEGNKCKAQQIMNETGLDEDALVYLYQGNRVWFGQSNAEILWPEKKTDSEYEKMITDEENENEMSMVIRIYHKGMSAIITGDIDAELMDLLTERHRRDNLLKCDILKVPHHGSKYSWSDAFTDSVSPEYAVIQVGKNNYGHPAPEIIEKYLNRGIKVMCNDQHGAIGFFEGKGSEIMVECMADSKSK